MDIEQTEDAWIVEAELPGVDPKDVSVEPNESELGEVLLSVRRHAMSGTDTVDVTERFVKVAEALAREHDEAVISVGVAELGPRDTLSDLVTRGDAALYKAKRRQA